MLGAMKPVSDFELSQVLIRLTLRHQEPSSQFAVHLLAPCVAATFNRPAAARRVSRLLIRNILPAKRLEPRPHYQHALFGMLSIVEESSVVMP